MNLITDRTQADVLAGTEKGFYTLRDLDRVEMATQSLCTELHRLDIHLPLTVCTQWQTQRKMPTREHMTRYLQNIRALSDALQLTPDLPESMENLNYQGANRIELTLEQSCKRVRGILESYQMSGELFAGEER